MNIILLSGGSGKRLWPLSNDIRSKQFLSLFKSEGAEMESMVQRMVRGIRRVAPDAKITFATAGTQVAALHHQLGDDIEISVEPMRRDTFPAIALSCLYLRDELHVDENEPVVICPVDPFVEDSYFEALAELSDLAGNRGERNLSMPIAENERTAEAKSQHDTKDNHAAQANSDDNRAVTEGANLYVMGIAPTYPSEKYGYILPADIAEAQEKEIFAVGSFKEKPNLETAKAYIEKGALWNGGVFAFRLKYVCDKAKEMTGHATYAEMFAVYEKLEKISFDYAVAEKETRLCAIKYKGAWKDLGTWNTLAESMSERVVGRAVIDDTCDNVHVINELDTPILCMGIKDAVVVAAPDGVLVADKHQSSYMKPYVDTFTDPARYAIKGWGEYRVIESDSEGLVIRVTLIAGNKMHYHAHERRDESWSVLSGEGEAIIDGQKRPLRKGSVVEIPRGTKHTLIAHTDLRAIEVQSGTGIDVADKIVFDMPE